MITEHDRRLLAEAEAKAKRLFEQFLKRHGFTAAEMLGWEEEFTKFLKAEDVPKPEGRTPFFNSPLARKAFLAGWVIRGRRKSGS